MMLPVVAVRLAQKYAFHMKSNWKNLKRQLEQILRLSWQRKVLNFASNIWQICKNLELEFQTCHFNIRIKEYKRQRQNKYKTPQGIILMHKGSRNS